MLDGGVPWTGVEGIVVRIGGGGTGEWNFAYARRPTTIHYPLPLLPTISTVPAKPLGPPPMTRPVNPDSRRRMTHRQTDLRHDDTIRDRLSSCAADTRINIII